ncbi:metallophosphoesterase [Kitasatospora sp. NPDC048540]|uniref:metallophosphoesterase n=1 Tax=unclassified Kitasatospora TaxID=2633591 RepID=UPI0009E6666F|nr:metallophosphoesterase [Kitasatospora sp. MBT63]
MTPEDRFPGPELPDSGRRPQQDLDVLPYGSYYEPAEPPAGHPYEQTYSGFGGARYLEQHWPTPGHLPTAQHPVTDTVPDGHYAPTGHYAPAGQFESGRLDGGPLEIRYDSGFEPEYAPPAAEAAPAPHPGTPQSEDPPTIELGAPIPDVHPEVHFPYPQPEPGEAPGPLYVIGDVHGYLDELLAALHQQGLIDDEGHWAAGRSRVWFLGDFTDRGPDGIGVINLVMQLAAEAAAAGGYCRALMGNHELLFLGAARYGDEPVQSTAGTASFLAAWRLNGGQQHDLDRLEQHHISWLSRLPAIAIEDGHLLLHSDTTAYLEYGHSIADVNDAVHVVLADEGIDEWWDCFRKFTKRFAFRGQAGPQAVHELLDTYGGYRVVHGHSPIPYLTGVDQADDAPPHVPGPYIYADELAIAMDGGVTMEGRLLVAQLPLN